MSVWWMAFAALGVVPAYLLGCILVGFVVGLAEGLGFRRRPKLRVVGFKEEE